MRTFTQVPALYVRMVVVVEQLSAGGAWAPCPSLCTGPERYSHTACANGKNVLVFGGFTGNECLNDLHAFDLDTRQWSEVTRQNGNELSVH